MTTAILIHGMGRTPLSMLLLATRLRLAGLRPKLFAYSAAFEDWQSCTSRLKKYIDGNANSGNYIVIGHSLGAVMARAVLPMVEYSPKAFFLLAPPSTACKAARRFAPLHVYRACTGEMGQLLASEKFMRVLPQPDVPAKIYAGTGGLRGRYTPFGARLNDGIVALHETLLPKVPVMKVATMHTFIMNDKNVAQDMIHFTHQAVQKESISLSCESPSAC